MRKLIFLCLTGFILYSACCACTAQVKAGSSVIQTAVPFLLISPDARSSGMGEVGSAISNDASAMFWNCSAISFITAKNSVITSYSPWLRSLASDVHFLYGSYAHKLDEKRGIGTSVRYFSLGEQAYTDENNSTLSLQSPYEFSLDVAYAQKLSNRLSIGTAFRFIYSGLYSNTTEQNPIYPGTAIASDISLSYRINSKEVNSYGIGMVVSNIGSKISYYKDGEEAFLPANLRLGISNVRELNSALGLILTVEVSKLLVPSILIMDQDEDILNSQYKGPSVMSGIFGSFTDAPGGLKEELREISAGGGVEFMFARSVSVRGGYHFENPTKGNRCFLTTGLGINYGIGKIDLSYLISNKATNALNTFRFSLNLNF